MDQALKITGNQTKPDFWKEQNVYSSKSPCLSVFTDKQIPDYTGT